jgi:hypothetical protein
MLIGQQQQQQVNANSLLEVNQVGQEGLVESLQEIEHEIECPKCNDMIMVLSADFHSLCYLCEECNFSLSL